MKIDEVLKEREKNYGDFASFSFVSQSLKKLTNLGCFDDYQQEALDMILHKIARIINGDASHIDSWRDIAGYATLAQNILENKEKEAARDD